MSEFDKVIGCRAIKDELVRYCDIIKNPAKYKSLGVKMPGGILFHGNPGLGKTLMAECFIAEAGCDSLTLRKRASGGDFVKEIKEIYEKAKTGGMTIVFLDDVDKFSNEDYTRSNPETYITIQSCIDECKGKGVFTLATANDKDILPASLLRAGRFDKIIGFDTPDTDDARDIIDHYMDSMKLAGDIDSEEIAHILDGRSCADLAAAINEAGIYAAFDGRDKINQKDMIRACLRVLFEEPESYAEIGAERRERIAVHEAGHVVVSEILEPGSVSLVSISEHTGDVGGYTKFIEPRNNHFLRQHRENDIMRSLGGKAAIEIVYGDADMGCSNDMIYASHIAFDLLAQNCAYDFRGFFHGVDDSLYTKEESDRIIEYEITHFYSRAKKMIAENRALLDAVVDALLRDETISYRGIQQMKDRLRKAA